MRDADNELVKRLARLKSDIIAMKASQRSGSGNVRSYIAETNDTWDLDVTATTTGVGFYGSFGSIQATFQADTKEAAFTTFEITCLINGQPFYTTTATSADFIIYTGLAGQTSGDINVAKYQSQINIIWGANTGTNIKIKIRAVSVDTGQLSLVHS